MKRQIRSYTPVVPLKTIPGSRPKWAKSIPAFRPKRRRNHTLWGSTYLYGLYRGVPILLVCSSCSLLLHSPPRNAHFYCFFPLLYQQLIDHDLIFPFKNLPQYSRIILLLEYASFSTDRQPIAAKIYVVYQ